MRLVIKILITLFLALANISANATECLFVSSYHIGYEWSDGIERGLRQTLGDKCNIKSIYMDTKRHKSEQYIKKIARQTKNIIDSSHPDIVITADDNAAKYLITPYYRNAKLPFVFTGINWTVKQYGFPFRNVTGIIEVAAISQLFDSTNAITGNINTAFYIGENTYTEQKNITRFITSAAKHNVQIKSRLVNTMKEWLDAYKEAQRYNLIIIGSNAGIKHWNKTTVLTSINTMSSKLTATVEGWMMPYAMFGMTKVPEEQGEWAGQIAIEILNGTKPSDIPIIPNRKFNIVVNKSLLSVAEIKLPDFLKRKANAYP